MTGLRPRPGGRRNWLTRKNVFPRMSRECITSTQTVLIAMYVATRLLRILLAQIRTATPSFINSQSARKRSRSVTRRWNVVLLKQSGRTDQSLNNDNYFSIVYGDLIALNVIVRR